MSIKKRLTKKKALTSPKQVLTTKLLEQLRTAPGFPVNLDFERNKCTLSGHGFGGGVPADDRFTITVYGTADKYAYPLATIRFNRAEWEKFKKLGDDLLKHLKKHRKKNSHKKK